MNKLGAGSEHICEAGDSDRSTSLQRRIFAASDYLCGITDAGRVRDRNEDAFYISDDGRVLLVADGMGGHDTGEIASTLAIEAAGEYLARARQASKDDPNEVLRAMSDALQEAHRRVSDAGQHQDSSRRMGCTILLAFLSSEQLYTCHVGDVRCYVWAAGGLAQITRDHSVVAKLVEVGHITKEEARVHPKKNEVLQAIGMPCGIEPDANFQTLGTGDRVLLCSDGLWESLSDEEIREVITSDGTMRQLATQLVDRAIRAGGLDNITLVLYEHALEGRSDEMG